MVSYHELKEKLKQKFSYIYSYHHEGNREDDDEFLLNELEYRSNNEHEDYLDAIHLLTACTSIYDSNREKAFYILMKLADSGYPLAYFALAAIYYESYIESLDDKHLSTAVHFANLGHINGDNDATELFQYFNSEQFLSEKSYNEQSQQQVLAGQDSEKCLRENALTEQQWKEAIYSAANMILSSKKYAKKIAGLAAFVLNGNIFALETLNYLASIVGGKRFFKLDKKYDTFHPVSIFSIINSSKRTSCHLPTCIEITMRKIQREFKRPHPQLALGGNQLLFYRDYFNPVISKTIDAPVRDKLDFVERKKEPIKTLCQSR